jgi:hypothetical protein
VPRPPLVEHSSEVDTVTIALIVGAFIVGCGSGYTVGAWWYSRPEDTP